MLVETTACQNWRIFIRQHQGVSLTCEFRQIRGNCSLFLLVADHHELVATFLAVIRRRMPIHVASYQLVTRATRFAFHNGLLHRLANAFIVLIYTSVILVNYNFN